MALDTLELELKGLMQSLSNGETAEVDPEVFEAAAEQLVTAFKKQLTQKREKGFRVRMSNVGRPLCTLQMEKSGAEREPFPYNHIMRMMIGDCVEVITRMLLTIAKVDVTSDGDDVTMKVSKTKINGSSDIDIDGKVVDIKSSAPWAYKNKWAKGFDALLAEDDFGYVGQLFGYADAQNKPPGGWIVVDKSSGELMVVPVTATVDQCKAIRARRKHTVGSLESGAPFQRGFEAEEETFQRKETGKKTLCKSCGFCSFKKTCWPTAQYKPQAESKAKFPPHKWYVDAD